MNMSKKSCFCTLAVGNRYRTHARMLAKDIQQHMAGKVLCVLTDRPEYFKEFSHVIPFKHNLQSVKGYHDKRFVLKKALSLFESCMFLDSDVRIIGGVTGEMNWLPGITARTGCDLLQHMTKIKNPKEIQVIEEAAKKLNIDLQQVQFLHEFMFTMRKHAGLEDQFIQLWQTISYFFEMQGIYHGECYAMGLAAAKVGMTIRFDREDKFPFFKDNIELTRIKNGQSNPQDKQIYFEIHKEIEYRKLSILLKIIDKLTQKVVLFYRLLRLEIVARKDSYFQKTFM
jgi:hypothetical protein